MQPPAICTLGNSADLSLAKINATLLMVFPGKDVDDSLLGNSLNPAIVRGATETH